MAPIVESTRQALSLLADGAWHTREQLLAEIAAQIPPEKAFRRWHSNAQRSDYGWTTCPNCGTKHMTHEYPAEHKIYYGQRNLAQGVLSRLLRNNSSGRSRKDGKVIPYYRDPWVETRGKGASRELRITEAGKGMLDGRG